MTQRCATTRAAYHLGVSVAAPYAAEPRVGRIARVRPALAVSVALIVAAGVVTVVATGDVLVWTGWFALFSAYNVLAFTGAALLWLRLRPRSGVGGVLLALAALTALQSLQGSSSSIAFSLGVLADPFTALAAWYLLLAFPSVRLSRPAAAVFGIGVVGVLVGFVPWFFLSPHVAGGTPLARCTAACPANALMVLDRPDVAGHFAKAEEILAVTFAVAFLVLVGARLVLSSPPRRRVLAPVHAVGAFWLAVFGAYYVSAYLVVADARVYDTLGWLLTAARIALPLAFVLALVLARAFAGQALEAMLQRVGTRPSVSELEHAARDALGDPSLRIAGPDEDPQPGRTLRPLRSDGRVVAELRYDESLDADPELVDAAATAVLLSLERGAILSELRRSEDRVVAERRRLERDLHDSAQQRLVALRIGMGLVQERLGGDPELERLENEVDTVLDELRSLARGAYPPTLREEGLGAALADVVRTHPRARLERGPLRRYPAELEATVYFSAVEALQNASKHAGPDARIVVSVREQGGELRFDVRDDGRGFEPESADGDGGLAGIAERLRAYRGTLTVTSAPGHGTRVAGAVPL